MKKLILFYFLFVYGSKVLMAQCNSYAAIFASAEYSSIALAKDGTIWGTGKNTYGELGLGNNTATNIFTQIGTSNWRTVSLTSRHTVAINIDGSLWAWGDNSAGQLGNGNTTSNNAPIQIGTSHDWIAVAAGYYNSYAIKADGSIWAWGDNTYGQIGNGTATSVLTPTRIGTDNKWLQISAGNSFVMAVKTDGSLWGWGVNSFGQLGMGNYTSQNAPQQIGSDYNWRKVQTKYVTTHAIKQDGSLWGCGYNGYGQIGIGSSTNQNALVQIGSSYNWVDVASGYYHTLAINNTNQLYAWGDNIYGQLCNGSTTASFSPTIAATGTTWSAIAAGAYISYAIASNCELQAVGYNVQGTLGIGTNTTQTNLTTVLAAPTITNIANTNTASTAVQANYTSYATADCKAIATIQQRGLLPITGPTTATVWIDASQNSLYVKRHYEIWPHDNQSNYSGWVTLYFTQQEFDDFNAVNSTDLPTGPTDNLGKANLFIESRNGKTIDGTGNLESYGNSGFIDPSDNDIVWNATLNRWEVSFYANSFGSFWVKTFLLSIANTCQSFSNIAGSKSNHSLAIKNDGTLWSWGFNFYGQLGDGTYGNKNYPVQVGNRNTWLQVAAGSFHSAGIMTDSSLWVWGYNAYGQHGFGHGIDSEQPKKVLSNWKWKYVGCNFNSTFAIRADGTLWSVGYNGFGELGNGTATNSSLFVQVGTDNIWKTIDGGNSNIYAIKNDGTLWSWGNNSVGSLGHGNNTHSYIPIQVGTDTDWLKVNAGNAHALAIKNNGTLWTCGFNLSGQLGIGTTSFGQNTFQQVGTDNTWLDVYGGNNISIAIKKNGTLWAWGSNSNGELGNGTMTANLSPTQIGTATNWVAAVAGTGSTVGLNGKGELWGAGVNNFGQLCNNTNTNQATLLLSQTGVTYGALPNVSKSKTTLQRGYTLYEKDCNEIATVWSTGNNPINGLTTAKIYVESTQPVVLGETFVKRHYEITPHNNAATATGRVTIYATQQDFDDFNAIAAMKLPTAPGDNTGIANLLIEKREGTSSDGSGNLSTYGAATNIFVDDDDIVFNTTLNRWEITFNTTGFSGFWIKTILGYLPTNNTVKLSVIKQRSYLQLLCVADENNAQKYILEKSADAINFWPVTEKNSLGNGTNRYNYTDEIPVNNTYYRIKQIMQNGSSVYSNVVKINPSIENEIQVFPNPTANTLIVKMGNGIANAPILVYNAAGKIMYQNKMQNSQISIPVSDWPSGLYFVKVNDKLQKFVKL